jgi:hypothetical protein
VSTQGGGSAGGSPNFGSGTNGQVQIIE